MLLLSSSVPAGSDILANGHLGLVVLLLLLFPSAAAINQRLFHTNTAIISTSANVCDCSEALTVHLAIKYEI